MPLLNYTTKVNAQKTVTEVMGLLVAKEADEISIVYDDNQQPCWPEVDRPESPAGQGKCALPCNIGAVFIYLSEQRVDDQLGCAGESLSSVLRE